MKKGNKGFTLIELLVVIAIIAILSTVVMAGLNSARAKGRDAKRLSDIKQVQSALELYQDSCEGYPNLIGSETWLNTTEATGCTDVTLGTFMNPLPVNPTPGGSDYTYSTTAERDTYSIGFSLEGTSGSLASGAHTAAPTGIQ